MSVAQRIRSKYMNINKRIIPIGLISLAVIALAAVLVFNFGTERGRINRMLNLGMKYIADGRFDDARVEFDKVLEIDGKNVEALRGLIESYLGLGDDSSVDEYLDKGIAIIENSSEKDLSDVLDSAAYIYYVKGQQAYSSNNSSESEKYYKISAGYNSKYKEKTGKDAFVKPLLDKVYDNPDNTDGGTNGTNPDGSDGNNSSNSGNSDSNGGSDNSDKNHSANSAVDVGGFKILDVSIYELASMDRDNLVDYCRARADLPYGQRFEYDGGISYDLYQDRPIESDITGWLMSVRNDISVSWGGPCATFDYAYIAGTPSTSTQLLSIKLQDDQGMRYLIACPNIPEMKPYVTIPDNFPPLDGGLEAVKSYLTSNGLEYKESERGISYYIPDDECPNGYIKAVLYFDERDGEICIQAILQ